MNVVVVEGGRGVWGYRIEEYPNSRNVLGKPHLPFFPCSFRTFQWLMVLISSIACIALLWLSSVDAKNKPKWVNMVEKNIKFFPGKVMGKERPGYEHREKKIVGLFGGANRNHWKDEIRANNKFGGAYLPRFSDVNVEAGSYTYIEMMDDDKYQIGYLLKVQGGGKVERGEVEEVVPELAIGLADILERSDLEKPSYSVEDRCGKADSFSGVKGNGELWKGGIQVGGENATFPLRRGMTIFVLVDGAEDKTTIWEVKEDTVDRKEFIEAGYYWRDPGYKQGDDYWYDDDCDDGKYVTVDEAMQLGKNLLKAKGRLLASFQASREVVKNPTCDPRTWTTCETRFRPLATKLVQVCTFQADVQVVGSFYRTWRRFSHNSCYFKSDWEVYTLGCNVATTVLVWTGIAILLACIGYYCCRRRGDRPPIIVACCTAISCPACCKSKRRSAAYVVEDARGGTRRPVLV